jgi:hypothetical protein
MPLLALALALTAPAAAPDPVADDLVCVAVVAMRISQTEDKDIKMGLAAGMMYFIGRLDIRAPGYDLETNLRTLLDKPDVDATLDANAVRCGGIIQERGAYLSKVGASMQGKSAE